MNIRPAHPDESDALSAIATAAKASWGYSPEQLWRWADDLRIPAESIANEPTFVAEDEGRVLGVVQLDTTRDPWMIEHLWIRPSHTRRGIGGRLVRYVVGYAADHGQRELAVDSDPQAESFYLRHGARGVGEIFAPIEGQSSRVRPQLRLSVEDAA